MSWCRSSQESAATCSGFAPLPFHGLLPAGRHPYGQMQRPRPVAPSHGRAPRRPQMGGARLTGRLTNQATPGSTGAATAFRADLPPHPPRRSCSAPWRRRGGLRCGVFEGRIPWLALLAKSVLSVNQEERPSCESSSSAWPWRQQPWSQPPQPRARLTPVASTAPPPTHTRRCLTATTRRIRRSLTAHRTTRPADSRLQRPDRLPDRPGASPRPWVERHRASWREMLNVGGGSAVVYVTRICPGLRLSPPYSAWSSKPAIA